MSPLPDRKRPRLTQPAVHIGRQLLRLVGHGTWRVLHPATRGAFLEAVRPPALERLYYEAGDGWRAPLLRLDTLPGAPGEPVVVAHGLGLSADGLRYGDGQTLAAALRAAGFAVYLLSHRADDDAIPPAGRARAAIDFDRILERDVPAAVARVVADTGMERVHWVGHGLGGQLGLCWAASRPGSLASVVAVAAPMRFQAASGPRRRARALDLLPSRWRLPLRTAARLVAPLLDDDGFGDWLGDQHTAGGRLRGLLTYGTDDLPVGLLRQVLRWQEEGTPTSADGGLDWLEALVDAECPLLVVHGLEDGLCPPAAARAAVERWGGPWTVLEVPELGHLDLLHGEQAPDLVYAPLVGWLVGHRKNAWLDASTGARVDRFRGAPWPRAESESPATSSSATARTASSG